MIIETARPEAVRYIIDHLRARDAEEIYALRLTDDPDVLFADWQAGVPIRVAEGVVCADDGEPVAVIGVSLTGPGVGVVHMFATDRWREVARDAHKFVRRVALPRVAAPVFRRLECRALENHDIAGRWLKRLGFVREGTHPCLGKGEQTYVTFGWINPAYRKGDA